jgi:hypothetical protein
MFDILGLYQMAVFRIYNKATSYSISNVRHTRPISVGGVRLEATSYSISNVRHTRPISVGGVRL